LEESIALHREALVFRPAPHPDRSQSLNNLAAVLWTQFEQKGRPGDLEESIALNREALVLFPAPHPQRSLSLNNLATTLWTQFKQKGQLRDLEESIALHHEALVLRPVPHPDRSQSLNNLANALEDQFKQKGKLRDLDESITLHCEALALTPVPHPDRSQLLHNLATTLLTRFEQTSKPSDLEQSMLHFSTASQYETASVLQKFDISRQWACHAVFAHHPSALQAYQNAISLLPHLASLDLSLQKRHKALSRAWGLANEACGYAIRVGNPDKAVEFLSAGRAVFWAQAMQLRTPFDKLQSTAPQLANKLRAISSALESVSHLSTFQHISSQPARDLEKEATHYRLLAKDWNDALDEV
jgi:tetratricopeptide (TPR) repeat protein